MSEGAGSPLLSIVVPMFNEEQVLEQFFNALSQAMKNITSDYEIICVNDGSSDSTLSCLTEYSNIDSRIKIVSLSRNFGKDIALTAGIDHSSGRAVIPLDADLQDPPYVIESMLEKWREGNDIVLAVRKDRSSDSWLKRSTAQAFYALINHISEVSIPPNVGDFRLMDRRVVDAVRLMPERTRFMKGIFAWVGFKTSSVFYERPPRAAGFTKWQYWNLWKLALDGIVSFSTTPLKLWSYLGAACALFAFGYLVYIVTRTLIFGVDLPGYASLLSVSLFFNGLILISIGVFGEYLGRIFTEVKGRPLYLVRERIGFDGPETGPRG